VEFFKNSWDNVLSDVFEDQRFKNIIEKVGEEYARHTIYPPRSKVFNAFKLTPYNEVKVVILGQDPYHGEGQAHGACFSVLPGVKCPPSLVNIYKEIESDIGCKMSSSGYLAPWAKQGVFLLNSVLTVRAGQAGSHQQIGWQWFTDEVIKKLSERKDPIVFLLWGSYAISKRKLIDESKHLVLTAPHPSPLSAYNGFFGCKHFSASNTALEKWGKTPINWQN